MPLQGGSHVCDYAFFADFNISRKEVRVARDLLSSFRFLQDHRRPSLRARRWEARGGHEIRRHLLLCLVPVARTLGHRRDHRHHWTTPVARVLIGLLAYHAIFLLILSIHSAVYFSVTQQPNGVQTLEH